MSSYPGPSDSFDIFAPQLADYDTLIGISPHQEYRSLAAYSLYQQQQDTFFLVGSHDRKYSSFHVLDVDLLNSTSFCKFRFGSASDSDQVASSEKLENHV